MHFVLVKTGGRRFRCLDCAGSDPDEIARQSKVAQCLPAAPEMTVELTPIG
jgi:hypothetical protein